MASGELQAAIGAFGASKAAHRDACDAVAEIVSTFHACDREDQHANSLMTGWLKTLTRPDHALTVNETEVMSIQMAATTTPESRIQYGGLNSDTLIHDQASTGGAGNIYPLLLSAVVQAVDIGRPKANVKVASNGSPGTIDTLQAAPGFNAEPSVQEISDALLSRGQIVTMATASAAPVDARIMALRRASGTMNCTELVISSILAKRLASAAEGFAPHVSVVVFEGADSKFGTGAIEQQTGLEKFRKVGEALCRQGALSGFVALPVNNDSPLCPVFGRSLFLREIRNVLRSEAGSRSRLAERIIDLAGQVIHSMSAMSVEHASERVREVLGEDGQAWRGFKDLLTGQGTEPEFVDNLERGDLGQSAVTVIPVTAAMLFPEANSDRPYVSIKAGGTKIIEEVLKEITGKTPADRGTDLFNHTGIELVATRDGSTIVTGASPSPEDVVIRLFVDHQDDVDTFISRLRNAFETRPSA